MNTNHHYAEFLAEMLSPSVAKKFTALDLFAGCGGLALGFESAGFETIGYEMDAAGRTTYRGNLRGPCHEVFLTPETIFPTADIVIGGPPCQPFSVGGHQSPTCLMAPVTLLVAQPLNRFVHQVIARSLILMMSWMC